MFFFIVLAPGPGIDRRTGTCKADVIRTTVLHHCMVFSARSSLNVVFLTNASD